MAGDAVGVGVRLVRDAPVAGAWAMTGRARLKQTPDMDRSVNNFIGAETLLLGGSGGNGKPKGKMTND